MNCRYKRQLGVLTHFIKAVYYIFLNTEQHATIVTTAPPILQVLGLFQTHPDGIKFGMQRTEELQPLDQDFGSTKCYRFQQCQRFLRFFNASNHFILFVSLCCCEMTNAMCLGQHFRIGLPHLFVVFRVKAVKFFMKPTQVDLLAVLHVRHAKVRQTLFKVDLLLFRKRLGLCGA